MRRGETSVSNWYRYLTALNSGLPEPGSPLFRLHPPRR